MTCNNTDFKYKISDELEDLLDEVMKIRIYSIDRSRRTISYDTKDWLLYTEDFIRENSSELTFYSCSSTNQIQFIIYLLYTANEINIKAENNIVQIKMIGNLPVVRDSGMVIDFYDYGGEIFKTYIMQNGLDVFYEKGKEDIYYKMPKLLLDKYYINENEFLSHVIQGSIWSLFKK